ncbi:hypothetical protein ACFX15_010589 [Malus domestica]
MCLQTHKTRKIQQAAKVGAMRAAGEGGTRKGSRNGRREARSIAIFIFCVVLIFAQTSNLMVFASTPTTSTSHDNEWTGRIMRSSPQRKARFLGKVSFYAPSSSPSHHVHRLPAINGDPGKPYGDDKRIVHTGPNPLHN